jgi:small-conductance mechanosensitive channel
MDTISGWYDSFQGSVAGLMAGFASFLPLLLGAVILLLIGWLLARLARRGATSLALSATGTIDHIVNRGRQKRVQLPPQMPKLIGDVVYWVIILFFVTAAARVARFDTVSGWLDRIVTYIPTLVAGGAIVFLGYVVSAIVRDIVSGAAGSAGFAQSRLLGLAAQSATFMTGLVIGLDQIGIDVTFLVTVIAIMLAAVLAGLSLAFGLGARTFADNLVNARNVQRLYRRGQKVRIGDLEGEIIELTQTAVVMASEQGRTTIPARLFGEQVSVLVTPEETDG